MKKGSIIALAIAGGCVVVGLSVAAGGIAALNGDWMSLDQHEYVQSPYTFSASVSKIEISETTGDIEIKHSADSEISVVCDEIKDALHTVAITGDTLSIQSNYHDVTWWDWFIKGPMLKKTSITISLPDVQYTKLKIDSFTGDIIFTDGFDIEAVEIETDTGDISFVDFSSENVKASTSTGDIELKNGVAENIDIDSSTGRITLEDINGTSLEGDTSTGNINLKNVICTGEMDLSSQTGDIKFDHSDANNIDVTTSTGDIFGTILTPKVFICSSSTGNVNVPSTNYGGRFEANTSTGNIEITIAP